MSPRPRNAPKAPLTACAPLRLSITSFGLGRATSLGLFSPESVLQDKPVSRSAVVAVAGSPAVGVAGVPGATVPCVGVETGPAPPVAVDVLLPVVPADWEPPLGAVDVPLVPL